MTYEWNAGKAGANAAKHEVTFEDASSVFLDPFAVTHDVPDHSEDELREITIGSTLKGQVVFVSHCERRRRIRVMNARPATRAEREKYE